MNNTTYDKANSIVDMRGVGKKKQDILDTIFSQRDNYIVENDAILQSAIKELFSTDFMPHSTTTTDTNMFFFDNDI